LLAILCAATFAYPTGSKTQELEGKVKKVENEENMESEPTTLATTLADDVTTTTDTKTVRLLKD
jgi:hypothetical protein